MPPTIHRGYRLIIAALVVYWLAMFAGTHYPKAPEVALNANDKVLHFYGYFGVAFLLVSGWQLSPGPGPKRSARIIGIVMLIVAAYGAFDEITQIPVGRDCSFYDWLADVAGGTAGSLLATAGFLVWRRMRPVDVEA